MSSATAISKLRSGLRRQKDERSDQITDRDSLQHAGNTNRSELKIRKAVEKQSETKDDRAAFDDFEIQVAFYIPLFNAPRKCERDRNTDDK
jgi:hypothetical protein